MKRFVAGRLVDFSDIACRCCGWHHQLDAFTPKMDVRVVENSVPLPRPLRFILLGEVGTVVEWRAYNSDVWVRVRFPDGERANFSPCQLEHA